MILLKRGLSRTYRVLYARAVSERHADTGFRVTLKACRCWPAGQKGCRPVMSAGVRARGVIIVNGAREFAARSSLLSNANMHPIERRERY